MQNNKNKVAAERAAGAVGAGPANQQAPDVCDAVKQVVDYLRANYYLAVRMEDVVREVERRFPMVMVDGRGLVPVEWRDVWGCLRREQTVELVTVRGAFSGEEVVWLWDDSLLKKFIYDIALMARNRGFVFKAVAEKPSERL